MSITAKSVAKPYDPAPDPPTEVQGVEIPDLEAGVASPQWLLDRSLEDTFPASDPVSSNHCD